MAYLHPVGTPALSEDFKLLNNPELFSFLPVLEMVLAPYDDVRVIVSSDWRRLFDDAALVRLLGNVGERFFGVVEHYNIVRAVEIQAEADRRKLARWNAVDDHPSVVHAARNDWRFVPTQPSLGLSDVVAQARLRVALDRVTCRQR
jgi:hypothetical protein